MKTTTTAEEPAYKYTRHQVPRVRRADAETDRALYLFKNVSVMHATYQVRLLAYFAAISGRKLIIQVPRYCRKGDTLAQLMKQQPQLIQLEKV
jgi:hypothetical protein